MERFLKNSGQKKMKRLFYQEMCNGKKVTPGVTSLDDRLMVSSVVEFDGEMCTAQSKKS